MRSNFYIMFALLAFVPLSFFVEKSIAQNIDDQNVHSEDVHSEDVHSEDVHSEDVHSEDVHSEDVHSEDMHSEDMEPEELPKLDSSDFEFKRNTQASDAVERVSRGFFIGIFSVVIIAVLFIPWATVITYLLSASLMVFSIHVFDTWLTGSFDLLPNGGGLFSSYGYDDDKWWWYQQMYGDE
ncbi:unnamed protein product [Meganyctiphanes norvegica]|uniref:Uncharacterized protein n=1 Tax=Meganyctiphanes norvegica TaxID=48144 RepID=A0AAV2RAZ3_MEGNR